jgi:hypothetical protein
MVKVGKPSRFTLVPEEIKRGRITHLELSAKVGKPSRFTLVPEEVKRDALRTLSCRQK